jgi:hypothetical protein
MSRWDNSRFRSNKVQASSVQQARHLDGALYEAGIIAFHASLSWRMACAVNKAGEVIE